MTKVKVIKVKEFNDKFATKYWNAEDKFISENIAKASGLTLDQVDKAFTRFPRFMRFVCKWIYKVRVEMVPMPYNDNDIVHNRINFYHHEELVDRIQIRVVMVEK